MVRLALELAEFDRIVDDPTIDAVYLLQLTLNLLKPISQNMPWGVAPSGQAMAGSMDIDELASACDGWRVIDVVSHLAALAHEAVAPPAPDPTWPENRERYHDDDSYH